MKGKTKKQLIEELEALRKQVDELKEAKIKLKKAEASLVREKNFTDSAINSLPGNFYLFDENGRIHRWNRNLEIVSEYSAEEISKMNPLDFFVGEEKKLVNKAIQEVFVKGQSTVEAHLMSKDGRKTPYFFTGLRFISNNQKYIVGMGIDITERKQAEEELSRYSKRLEEMVEERTAELRIANEQLKQEINERKRAEEELKSSREQLRNLYAHLQSIREEQRVQLAREIHDELGQVLTAIKMEFGLLIDGLSTEQKGIIQYTGSLYQLIDKALDTVQKICTELRPAILDELGLSAAIEWQTGEFEKWSDIKCEVIFEPKEIILDKEYSIALFRIFQEVLTNVARHAQAAKVKIRLKKKQDKVILSIKDDGIGITKEKISNHKSLGLIGIRERINLLRGNFIIRGIQGKGTTVTVSIPIKTKWNWRIG